MNLKLRCKFCEKPYKFKKERELRVSAKEKINKIGGLSEEVENNLDGETKVSKLLTDLEYEKIEALHNITVLEPKLEKLEISPKQIGRIKDLILLSLFMLF